MLDWESLGGWPSFCLGSSEQCLDLILLMVARDVPVFLLILNLESPKWKNNRELYCRDFLYGRVRWIESLGGPNLSFNMYVVRSQGHIILLNTIQQSTKSGNHIKFLFPKNQITKLFQWVTMIGLSVRLPKMVVGTSYSKLYILTY